MYAYKPPLRLWPRQERFENVDNLPYILIICYLLRCSLSGSSTLLFMTVPSLWVTMVAAPGNIQPRLTPPLSTLNGHYPCLCSFGVQWRALNMFDCNSLSKNSSSMAVMPGLEPDAPLLAQTSEHANQHPLVTIKPRTRVFE